MKKPNKTTHVPLSVRNECLEGLKLAIPQIIDIAQKGETQSLRLSAFDKLAKVGLGGRKTVLVEAPQLAEICLELVKEMFSPTREQMSALGERLVDELAALGGDEVEEDDELDPEA